MCKTEIKARLAWSIDAMMKAKAKQHGVTLQPHQTNAIVAKASAMIDEGFDVLSAFFTVRDEAELMLNRQIKSEAAIGQMIAMISNANDNFLLATPQAI